MKRYHLWVAIVLIMSIIALFTMTTVHVWDVGSSEKDYNTTCLGGHQYWRANYGVKAMLAIKLDDSGRPTRCIP